MATPLRPTQQRLGLEDPRVHCCDDRGESYYHRDTLKLRRSAGESFIESNSGDDGTISEKAIHSALEKVQINYPPTANKWFIPRNDFNRILDLPIIRRLLQGLKCLHSNSPAMREALATRIYHGEGEAPRCHKLLGALI